MRKLILAGLAVVFIAGVTSLASARVATLNYFRGRVEVQKAGTEVWEQAKMDMALEVNDKIMTHARSLAEIVLDDKSIIRLRENSLLQISTLSEDSLSGTKCSIFGLMLGKFWSSVRPLKDKDSTYEVHTPTAIAGVRGTRFSVQVQPDLSTRVSVFSGRVEVSAVREELRREIAPLVLGANQSTRIGLKEAPKPEPLPREERQEWQKWNEEVKSSYNRELSLDRRLEAQRKQVIRGIKDVDYQLGKSIIDVHGNRVRLEEYILRPQADQLKFLILNTRENRFDYAYELMTFNKELPHNFNLIARQAINGYWTTYPEYYLSAVQTYFANHYGDNMSWLLDEGYPRGIIRDNSLHYLQQFHYLLHTVSGIKKIEGSNLHPPLSSQDWWVAGKSGLTGDDVIPGYVDKHSLLSHDEIYLDYKETEGYNGTWEKWEFWMIDDEGNMLSRKDIASGKRGNGEIRLTAKEFEGRDIDVLYTPAVQIPGFQPE